MMASCYCAIKNFKFFFCFLRLFLDPFTWIHALDQCESSEKSGFVVKLGEGNHPSSFSFLTPCFVYSRPLDKYLSGFVTPLRILLEEIMSLYICIYMYIYNTLHHLAFIFCESLDGFALMTCSEGAV